MLTVLVVCTIFRHVRGIVLGVKNNWSMTTMATLPKLQQANGIAMGTKCGTPKSIKNMIIVLGKMINSDLVASIKQSRGPISLILDGSNG